MGMHVRIKDFKIKKIKNKNKTKTQLNEKKMHVYLIDSSAILKTVFHVTYISIKTQTISIIPARPLRITVNSIN